jgi:ADP-ribose pyrophosphatase YjhB (NUDIX family)
MQRVRDTFCSFCGTRYGEPLAYPRTCASCEIEIWANPIPVCVVLVPIVDGDRTGLLAIRRAIPPAIGKLALVGGFLEEHESWQQGAAREVREETNVSVDADALEPLWFASSSPKPNRVMLFSVAPPVRADRLPRFESDSETSERGVVFGPGGLEDVFAFSRHIEAAKRFFASRGITGPHAFVAR